jgi:hypothetical protein
MRNEILELINKYETQIKDIKAGITQARHQKHALKSKQLDARQYGQSGHEYQDGILQNAQTINRLTMQKGLYSNFINDLQKLSRKKLKTYDIRNRVGKQSHKQIVETIRLDKFYKMFAKVGPEFEEEARKLRNETAKKELKSYCLKTNFGTVRVEHSYNETKTKTNYILKIWSNDERADLKLLKKLLDNV